MKKRILSALLVLVMVVTMIPAFAIASTAATTADTTWYDDHENDSILHISSAAELLGFNKLLNADTSGASGSTFSGKTIKLDADIILNDGWDASTGTLTGGDVWLTTSGKFFNGVFDGQGHTISGIYLNTTAWNIGIFGRSQGGTVRNLVIKNSYVKGASNVGSIFGITATADCTIENVYSEAYVTSSATDTDVHQIGGLVGCAGNSHTLTVKSSVFAGTLKVSDQTRLYGGIIGKINGSATANIISSAFYGKIINNNDVVGGLVGRVYTDNMSAGKSEFYAATLNITDCISAGSIENKTAYTGAFYGQTMKYSELNLSSTDFSSTTTLLPNEKYANLKPTITITNSVYTDQAIGTYNNITKPVDGSTYTEETDANLKAATITVPAGFTVMTNKYPMPTAIANIFGTQKTVAIDIDKSWYNASDTYFEIDTAAQLLGFSDLLANGTTFANQTIALKADIDLNKDWFAGENAPTNVWKNNAGKTFSGIFDGDGYTISGIYLSANGNESGIFGGIANGATVKDLVVKNSYISNSAKLTGAIFGEISTGTSSIMNVYCDAIVYTKTITSSDNAGEIVKMGGLVGSVESGALNISSCVVNGVVDGYNAGSNSKYYRAIGGVIGYVNSGTVEITATAQYGLVINNADVIGGMVSRVSGGNVTMSNCVSAASIFTKSTSYVGAFVGQLTASPTVTISGGCFTGTYPAKGASISTVCGCENMAAVKIADLQTATATVPAGFTAMPEGYPMPITLANTVWAQDKNATTVFYGYQENETTNTEIRLVGLVNVEGTPSDTIKSVGYDITIIRENGKTWTKNEKIYNLYTSVLEEGSSVPTTAEALKADYIYVATLGNIQEEVTIVVKTFHETTEGAVGYDDILVFTYNPAA